MSDEGSGWIALARDQEKRFAAERIERLLAEIDELQKDLALAEIRVRELESTVELLSRPEKARI